MEIKFLGTGGVFDYEYGNSAALVRHKNKSILIDCGPSVYPTLRKHGLADTIDHILITHLHGDHVGSLFALILHMNIKRVPPTKAKVIYALPAFRQILYDYLSFSLQDPEKFIDFIPLSSIEDIGFLDTKDLHFAGMQSFAYYFKEQDRLIYYSGDLGNVNTSFDFLGQRSEADITVFHEMHHLKGKAHVYYRDLMQAMGDYQVYAYHLDPRKLPEDNTVPLVAEKPDLLISPR